MKVTTPTEKRQGIIAKPQPKKILQKSVPHLLIRPDMANKEHRQTIINLIEAKYFNTIITNPGQDFQTISQEVLTNLHENVDNLQKYWSEMVKQARAQIERRVERASKRLLNDSVSAIIEDIRTRMQTFKNPKNYLLVYPYLCYIGVLDQTTAWQNFYHNWSDEMYLQELYTDLPTWNAQLEAMRAKFPGQSQSIRNEVHRYLQSRSDYRGKELLYPTLANNITDKLTRIYGLNRSYLFL